jgi:hypothetical protein
LTEAEVADQRVGITSLTSPMNRSADRLLAGRANDRAMSSREAVWSSSHEEFGVNGYLGNNRRQIGRIQLHNGSECRRWRAPHWTNRLSE